MVFTHDVFTHDRIAPRRSLDRGVAARASWRKRDAGGGWLGDDPLTERARMGARDGMGNREPGGDRWLSTAVGCARASELSGGSLHSTSHLGEATPSGVISGAPVT